MKKILISVMSLALVVGLLGAGAFAYFNDTETSEGNAFTAGTLDMKVDGQDDGGTLVHVTLDKMEPGNDSGYYKWVIKNEGNVDGELSATFSAITNNDNGCNEPECLAEGGTWDGTSCTGATCGDDQGELGQYLKPGIEPSAVEGMAGVTIVERNDEEGWFIASVDDEIDTGGTIGWGPKGWSCPSRLYSQWQAGPPHAWGTPGLNGLGGNTYGTLAYLSGDVLGPGEEVAFFLRLKLDSDLQKWDGTKWVDVDDNIIQSDSVVFDITFTLVSNG